MATSYPANSIASVIRQAESASRLLDDEIDFLSELFAFCAEYRRRPPAAAGLPSKLDKETVVEAAATCRRALLISDEDTSLILPEQLDKRLGILVWRVPLASSSGGYFSSSAGRHIVVADHTGIAPWLACARHFGNLLIVEAHQQRCEFEATRLDNLSEKRTLNSIANSFAMELLMPPWSFVNALRTLRRSYNANDSSPVGDIELLWLSRIFGCSFFAVGKRAEQIGLLPKGAAAALTNKLHEFGGPEGRAKALGMPDRLDRHFPSIPNSILGIAADGVMRGALQRGRIKHLFARLINNHQRALH